MKERGMIFNGEMVRAILDGRKTQTRRIMKLQPKPSKSRPGDFWFSSKKLESMVHVSDLAPGNSPIADYHLFIQEHCCPFGAVGDRIWVRETFQGPLFDYDLMDSYCKDPTPFEKPEFCVYKADGVPAPEFYDADDELHCCWRPSIHMPRWASRILLEITSVRVERLRSMSQDDARAEGVIAASGPMEAGLAFRELWDSIYGEESWKANPWVWVIEFKRVEGGAA
ncbi:TPA: morphogenetic protein [Klebsiella variicola subsp. variicola]